MTDPAIARKYRLDGVITTVDAVNGEGTLDRQVESVKQAAMADRLLLTKADLVDSEALAQLQSRLRVLNPAAPQMVAENGTVDPALLFDAGLYNPNSKTLDVQNWLKAEAYDTSHGHDHNHHTHDHAHSHSHHHHHDVNRHDEHIKALCLTLDDPIPGDVLEYWLGTLLQLRGEDCLRIKGIINVAELDQPMVVHGVQHIFHPPVMLDEWPDDDHRSRIVFITRNIEQSQLQDLLALLTEYQADHPEVHSGSRYIDKAIAGVPT